MTIDKIIINSEQKNIDGLKIERIFLNDKARAYQNKLKETIEELKAEITYWKETTEYNLNKLKEQKRKIYDLENENEELKSKVYDLEVNNQTLEGDNTYWREKAFYWRDKCEETEIELDYWQSYY